MNDLITGWYDVPSTTVADGPAAAMLTRLPDQPLSALSSRQAELTDRFLLPVLEDLHACFLAVRTRLDPYLRQRQPVKQGKPYPLGQCLEISLAVQHTLKRLRRGTLTGAAARGHEALVGFLQAGGQFRQVWGDLRNTFFQNAFQLGTLYVDVSNDTVTPTKPKIEILPFSQAGFAPITDFRHFARIAVRYWQDRVYPNHILPELAPYCPLIHVNQHGRVQLHDTSRYMLALTLSGRFQPAEDVLRGPPMPATLFEHVARALEGQPFTIARHPEAGQQAALQACQRYRAKRWHDQPRQTVRAVTQARRANQKLLTAEPLLAKPHYVPVSRSQHADQCWQDGAGYLYTRHDVYAPLVMQEVLQAAATHPLAFIEHRGRWQPVALLRLTAATHHHVDATGAWLTAHRPACYQGYPLRLVDTGPDRQTLCIDQHSSRLSTTQGHAFFEASGALSAPTAARLQQLSALHGELLRAAQAGALLHGHGLLRPWPIDGAAALGLPPLYRFDDAALATLDNATRQAVRHSGALGLGYCQALSMQHAKALQSPHASR